MLFEMPARDGARNETQKQERISAQRGRKRHTEDSRGDDEERHGQRAAKGGCTKTQSQEKERADQRNGQDHQHFGVAVCCSGRNVDRHYRVADGDDHLCRSQIQTLERRAPGDHRQKDGACGEQRKVDQQNGIPGALDELLADTQHCQQGRKQARDADESPTVPQMGEGVLGLQYRTEAQARRVALQLDRIRRVRRSAEIQSRHDHYLKTKGYGGALM